MFNKELLMTKTSDDIITTGKFNLTRGNYSETATEYYGYLNDSLASSYGIDSIGSVSPQPTLNGKMLLGLYWWLELTGYLKLHFDAVVNDLGQQLNVINHTRNVSLLFDDANGNGLWVYSTGDVIHGEGTPVGEIQRALIASGESDSYSEVWEIQVVEGGGG